MPVDEQAWLDAWNSGRATPIIEISDPDVEVHAVTLGIEGRHYKGHDGLRDWMRDIGERFSARSEVQRIDWLGDDALMLHGTLFIDNGFGGEEEQRFVMVVRLSGDKARWIGTFFSGTDARSAYESGVTGPGPG